MPKTSKATRTKATKKSAARTSSAARGGKPVSSKKRSIKKSSAKQRAAKQRSAKKQTSASRRALADGVEATFTFRDRAAGVLLHPTSLPGPYGCGDMGPAAFAFVDFLEAAGQRWWQMLPTNPPGPGNAPYSPFSAFAGSPWLISLDFLVNEGLLAIGDLKPATGVRDDKVAYPAAKRFRDRALRRAFAEFAASGGLDRGDYHAWHEQTAHWVDEYALFTACQVAYEFAEWVDWPKSLRSRQASALERAREDLADEINFHRFCQFVYDHQWSQLRTYAAERGVGLIGDIPIFIAHNSADVWSQPELFVLDAAGNPKIITGVPPDAFSDDGQVWEHPHYAWPEHQRSGWTWWVARFERLIEHFDAARIDHFLGFHRAWAVPGKAKTARRGKWIPTPGAELFEAVQGKLGHVEMIAEDLGHVTPEAIALRDALEFPGMRIVQHAWYDDEGARSNQPHAHPRDSVCYTGTHDNDTLLGWWKEALKRDKRVRGRKKGSAALTDVQRVKRYANSDAREVHWDFIRMTYSSPANTAILPMQDLLALDNAARMNYPGTRSGNWEWRMPPRSATAALARRLRDVAHTYDRIRS